MLFAHAQVQEDDSVCREKKGREQQKGKKPTDGGLRKDATLNLERFLKFIFFFFLAESWDVSKLDFCNSKEKYSFSTAIGTNYLDISIRWDLFIHGSTGQLDVG